MQLSPVSHSIALSFILGISFDGPGASLWPLGLAQVGLVSTALLIVHRSLEREPSGASALRVTATRFHGVLLFYLLWMAVSSYWSSAPALSATLVWAVGALPMAALIWVQARPDEHDWSVLWRLLLAVALVAASWGLIQLAGGERRATGPFLDANVFGALMNLFILPLIGRLISVLGGGRRLSIGLPLAGALFLLLLALFGSGSRGAIGAYLLLFPLVFSVAYRARLAVAPALAATVFLTAVAFGASGSYGAVSVADRALQAPQNDRSIIARVHMAQSMLRIYAEHPLLGTGLGTYRMHYPRHRHAAETASSGDAGHNDYLQFLQEGGPVQLAFLLIIVGYCGIRLLRLLWRPDSCGRAPLEQAGLVTAICAISIHAAVNFIFYVFALALIAGAYVGRLSELAAEPRPRRRVTLPVARGMALGVAIALAALPLARLIADSAAVSILRDGGGAHIGISSDDERARFAHLMATLRPRAPHAHEFLGRYYLALSERPDRPAQRALAAHQAFRSYKRLLAVQPVDPTPHTALARLLLLKPEMLKVAAPQGEYPTAEAFAEHHLDQALRLHPGYYHAYELKALMYRGQDRPHQAFETLLVYLQNIVTLSAEEKNSYIAALETLLEIAVEQDMSAEIPAIAAALANADPGSDRPGKILSEQP